MAPAEQPTPISQKVTKGMQIAQNATMTAAQATGFVGNINLFKQQTGLHN